jgi:uncharacterized protein YfeS
MALLQACTYLPTFETYKYQNTLKKCISTWAPWGVDAGNRKLLHIELQTKEKGIIQ